jgi:hypothetical protein
VTDPSVVMPAGVPNDASPDDNIGSTTAQAVSFALGEMAEREAETHAQGSVLGDLMTMPPAPDIDTTILSSHIT